MLLLFSMFFFFFKQKTAYEMRISDWSSDVCSSDVPRERYGDCCPEPQQDPHQRHQAVGHGGQPETPALVYLADPFDGVLLNRLLGVRDRLGLHEGVRKPCEPVRDLEAGDPDAHGPPFLLDDGPGVFPDRRLHGRPDGRLVVAVVDVGGVVQRDQRRDFLLDGRLSVGVAVRSEEKTSELQSLMRILYAVFCLSKKKKQLNKNT